MIENCPMRHENGNCIPAGGFCTANKNICEALLNAYRMGKAQLSQEGTTLDTISRQAAIDIFDDYNIAVENGELEAYSRDRKGCVTMPTIQPQSTAGQLNDGAQSTAQSTNLIDRQDAIDALDFEIVHMTAYCDGKNEGNPLAQYNKGLEDGKKAIEALPSAQPEPQWIPVERELPEDFTDVLVWFEYFRYGDYNCMYATHGIGSYLKEYNSWTINHETGWKDLHVFAWMPLPESYKPNNK